LCASLPSRAAVCAATAEASMHDSGLREHPVSARPGAST